MLVLLPKVAMAVSINEVAWMGSATSANHEWIELYNPGEAVSVAGWTLSDGMNLNITLVGEIASASYAVLERTSEESAPGSAFLIYTGALVNGGATLTLRTAAGEIHDQVAGGEGWQNIGGDNITKETGQYRPSGWVTDLATPGAVNGPGRVEVPDIETATTTTTTTSSNTTSGNTSNAINRSSVKRSATTPLILKQTELRLKVERQEVAYVGQPIRFLVTSSGLSPSESRLLRYHWNFGDTNATSGTEVWHTYDYPGTYVVTVASRKGLNEQVERTEVTVVPVAVSLSFGLEGVVHLHNDSPYDIDVSGYTIQATKSIVFPPRSIVRAGGTVTLGLDKLGSFALGVTVFDRVGELVVTKRLGEVVVSETLPELGKAATTYLSSPYVLNATTDLLVPQPAPLQLSNATGPVPTSTIINIPRESSRVIGSTENRREYAVLVVLVLLILLSLYVRRGKT